MISLFGKTLVFGDLHIGVKSDSLSRLNLSIMCIENILQICKEEDVKNIIFLGDWFNSREYINTISLTVGIKLVELLAENHQVIIIAGNHDLESNTYNTVSPLFAFSSIKNVFVIHSPTEFMLNNKTALAVPWGFDNYNTNNSFDYVFGHLNVGGQAIRYNRVIGKISDNSDYVASNINDVRVFAKKLKHGGICFSGHIHLKSEQLYRTNRIIFVGSPYELNFGEVYEQHGIYIINNDNDVQFVSIDKMPKHKILRLSDCFDNNIIKSVDFFNNFNNCIIRKVLDKELTAEQQVDLDAMIDTAVQAYDFAATEYAFQQQDLLVEESENNQFTPEKYINIVLDGIDEAVFMDAKTTRNNLKEIFNTYIVEY